MAKILTVNTTKCTGCGTCELACSMKNTGEFNPTRSRIQVISLDTDFAQLPIVCVQCYRPPCAEICPTEAITRDKITGIVRVNAALCTGCRMCEDACPLGVIVFSELEQKAVKCELCDGDPQCVKSCPKGAIEYIDYDRIGIARKRAGIQKISKIMRLIMERAEVEVGKEE